MVPTAQRMERAPRGLLELVSVAALLAAPATALAQSQQIDAASKVYYQAPPNFGIGSWVKYRTSAKSLQGHVTDYTVTMLIAGEELWWGEPCFWLETVVEAGEERAEAASLISYEAFQDSMASDNFQWFIRKYIERLVDGKPAYMLYTRNSQDFKRHLREADENAPRTSRESLGRDTLTTAMGHFQANKVLRRWSRGQVTLEGDSTVSYRRTENSTLYFADEIPITHLAREDIDNLQEGKSWLSGQVNRDPMKVLERATGSMVLLGFGKGGVEPVLGPAQFRRPWREQGPNPPPDRWRAVPKAKGPATRG